jgi:hypothetical protein
LDPRPPRRWLAPGDTRGLGGLRVVVDLAARGGGGTTGGGRWVRVGDVAADGGGDARKGIGMSDPGVQTPLIPLLWFDSISLLSANHLLDAWGHRMGPLRRPMGGDLAHALVHREEGPVVVITTSTLIRDGVGGGLHHLCRSNALELSRLCGARPGLCRLGIRLWREFVFPLLGVPYAISYQDADLHNGATYRFDGWVRSPKKAHSGAAGKTSTFYLSADRDARRPGRDKWVWVWPPSGAEVAA